MKRAGKTATILYDDPKQLQRHKRAAKLNRRSLTGFLLEAGDRMAQEVLLSKGEVRDIRMQLKAEAQEAGL